jgi:lipopolysaccharide cholinephosphotransferase
MRGIMPKSELGAPTPVEFEGEQVWGVQERDTYLTRKYGDYMTIPKQAGQRQHNFHYMSLEEPYRTYRGK